MGKKAFERVCSEESGQGLAEYGLLIAFIALAVVISVFAFGLKVGNLYGNAVDNIGSAVS